MSYPIHIVKKVEGKWGIITPFWGDNAVSIGCLAGIPDIIEDLTDTVNISRDEYDDYGLCMQIESSQFTKEHQLLLEDKLFMKGDVEYLEDASWVTDGRFSAAPIFPLSDTYDDVHFKLLPYRLACERPGPVQTMFRQYPLEVMRNMTPREVKAIWFAAHMLAQEFTTLKLTNGWHQSNYSRFNVHYPISAVTVRDDALSALINADSYWRKRIPTIETPYVIAETADYFICDRTMRYNYSHNFGVYTEDHNNEWDRYQYQQAFDYLIATFNYMWTAVHKGKEAADYLHPNVVTASTNIQGQLRLRERRIQQQEVA